MIRRPNITQNPRDALADFHSYFDAFMDAADTATTSLAQIASAIEEIPQNDAGASTLTGTVHASELIGAIDTGMPYNSLLDVHYNPSTTDGSDLHAAYLAKIDAWLLQ